MNPVNAVAAHIPSSLAQMTTESAPANATTEESAVPLCLVANQDHSTRVQAAGPVTLCEPARSGSETTELLLDAITNDADTNSKDRVKVKDMAQCSPLHNTVKPDSPSALDAPHFALNTEGKSDSTSLQGQLQAIVLSGANQNAVRGYAERLCEDCFDTEAALSDAFYSSETPYHIAMELRNDGVDTSDIDSIDTLRDARERCGDYRAEWIAGAVDHIVPKIQELASRDAGVAADDYTILRDSIDSFYFGEARSLMWDMIHDQFQE